MIKLIDALRLMDDVDSEGAPRKFSLKYITHNRRSKSGGELIEIDEGVRCIGKRGGAPLFPSKSKEGGSKKAPNHFKNRTRNIYIPSSGQIRKCNIHLIVEFNGQPVVM